MLYDLESARKANQERLLGIKKTDTEPITKEMIFENQRYCWEIISIVIAKETEQFTDNDGKVKTRTLNKLRYPDLVESINVGERKRNKYGKTVQTRTNISTMRNIYSMRTKLSAYYEDDISNDDDYTKYFQSAVSALDGYALQCVCDMISDDDKFLTKINQIRAER